MDETATLDSYLGQLDKRLKNHPVVRKKVLKGILCDPAADRPSFLGIPRREWWAPLCNTPSTLRHGTEAVWSTPSIRHFQMHFWHSQAGTQAVIYPDVSQICKEPGQYKVQAYQRFSKILFNMSSVCWDGGLMPFGGLWRGPRASAGVEAQLYKSTIMTTMVGGPKN